MYNKLTVNSCLFACDFNVCVHYNKTYNEDTTSNSFVNDKIRGHFPDQDIIMDANISKRKERNLLRPFLVVVRNICIMFFNIIRLRDKVKLTIC